ncbi:phosphatidylserine decarboxylase proenzyme [Salmonella bongori]|nr:phosphatidylserine decarboxylase proenzyme [Salmonella bongori]
MISSCARCVMMCAPLNTDPNILVMPADGVISQLGRIEEE